MSTCGDIFESLPHSPVPIDYPTVEGWRAKAALCKQDLPFHHQGVGGIGYLSRVTATSIVPFLVQEPDEVDIAVSRLEIAERHDGNVETILVRHDGLCRLLRGFE